MKIGDIDLEPATRLFIMGMAAYTPHPPTLHPVKRSRKSRKRAKKRLRKKRA